MLAQDIATFQPKLNRAIGWLPMVLLALAGLVTTVGEAAPPGQLQGTPWVGAMGLTETTAEIMAREPDYQRPPKLPWKVPKHRPRGRVNVENLLLNPASPDTPTVPDAGPVSLAGQAGALSFTGATLADTAAFPPDSMGAAGPAQFIVAVNGRIRSFNKTTGVADGVLNVNPDVFFSPVMTPPAANNFTSDPRIRYDRLSGRWFIIIIDVPGQAGALPNRILLAVSASGVITPSTSWTFFQFQHDLVEPQSNTDTGNFADYPTLGIDPNALYIGVNIFGTRGQGSFANTTAFVIRKSSVLAAGPIVVTAFRKLVGNGLQGGPYTPQGVDNFDPAATEGYFIGVDSSYYGRLQLRRVSNPGGVPSISDNITLTVPITGNTINVPHLGNTGGASGALDGLDYRLLAAHVRNGRLWTCANIAVDNTGSPAGTDTRMGIRWYELNGIATGQTPGVVQSGTLFQPSASNDANQRHYWMGTMMVSGQGHALLGFSAAGAGERANAGYTGRLAGDPPGTLRTPVLYTASSSAYNPPSNPGGPGGRRWGDYSYTCVDPDDDMTMWTIQEFCTATDSYGVQVLKVLAPAPATPASCNPAALPAGASNVTVVLTGASDGDTGFFDPGPGYSNRISAAISGAGVTLNSVAYTDPTHLTLNLSVSSGALAGGRTLTVSNPDHQSATSPGAILSVIAGTNSPPTLAAIPDQTMNELTTLTFTNSASDPNGNALTFSLAPGAPAGAAVNALTGVFSWAPGEAQGPATNTLTVRVTAQGSPPLSDAKTFQITVNEVNSPPLLASLADRTLHQGSWLQITNQATDPDLPANAVTFSLAPNAPDGAAIDPLTGLLTWTPGEELVNTTNHLTVQVTDNGVPPLSDAQTFAILVVARPVLESLTLSNSVATLRWSAVAGQTYRVQYSPDLSDTNWSDLFPEVTASGPTASTTDSVGSGGQKFYRVTLRP